VNALLVSRFPRVDTPAWKRQVAVGLLDAGFDVAVVYTRSSLLDQARAGLREEGLGVLSRYAKLRGGGAGADSAPSETLAAWAERRGKAVHRGSRLGDDDVLSFVREHDTDIAILVGADIVPARFLALPRVGTINPHYGLLPGYRGMNVTEWSIYEGRPVGVTVHLVDAGIDTGDLLMRETIPLAPGETFESLRTKHQQVAAELLVRSAVALRDGTAERTPQSAAEGRQFYRMHPALRAAAERRLEAQAAGA
jgi:methionyl-tRNA formyltransferase